MAAFKTAMQANAAALVDSTSDSPADAYSFFTRLKYGQGYFWQNSPNNRFLLNPSDLQKVKNARTTQNQPLFDDADDTILGKPYVVHPDADRVYYGDFSVSVCRSRTPLYIQTLLELYAQAGLIGALQLPIRGLQVFRAANLSAHRLRQPGRGWSITRLARELPFP